MENKQSFLNIINLPATVCKTHTVMRKEAQRSVSQKQSSSYLVCKLTLQLSWLAIYHLLLLHLRLPPQIQTWAGCCRSEVWCYAGTVSWLQAPLRRIPRRRNSSLHRHCSTRSQQSAWSGLTKGRHRIHRFNRLATLIRFWICCKELIKAQVGKLNIQHYLINERHTFNWLDDPLNLCFFNPLTLSVSGWEIKRSYHYYVY